MEKFIGDAVVAVFGAPVAHEDDPERAVRAALAVRDAVAGLNESEPDRDLHVRVAVNTGQALVSLDASPGEGEAMVAGDVDQHGRPHPVGGAGRRDPRRRADLSRRRSARSSTASPEAIEAKGKAEPSPGLGSARGTFAGSASTSAVRGGQRSSDAIGSSTSSSTRSTRSRARAVDAARHARRRPRDR